AGEGWSGASIGHAVTWSVRDSAALLDATAGPDVGDPYWAPPMARPFLQEVGRDPGRLRIALTVTPWIEGPVDPECAEAARAAARLCASLGHHIEEARPQIDEAAWLQATLTIVTASLTFALETRAAALGRVLKEDDVERITWQRVQLGRSLSAADYARAIHTVHRTGRVVARFLETYDVLLTPTMAKPPHPLGVLSLSNPDSAAFMAARSAAARDNIRITAVNGRLTSSMTLPRVRKSDCRSVFSIIGPSTSATTSGDGSTRSLRSA